MTFSDLLADELELHNKPPLNKVTCPCYLTVALTNTTLPFLYSDGLNFDDNHTGWLWTLPARKVDNSKIISNYSTLLHLKGIAY